LITKPWPSSMRSKKDSVDVTDNTQLLVRQLTDNKVGTDDDSKLDNAVLPLWDGWKFVNAQFFA
jgi:hypothetical protein